MNEVPPFAKAMLAEAARIRGETEGTSDTSLEEARADFSGEGVIPESVLPGSG